MFGGRPLVLVVLSAVRLLSLCANVPVSVTMLNHVAVCCRLFLESNFDECWLERILEKMEFVTIVAFGGSVGQQKDLQHGQGKIVIVLSCRREFESVAPELSGKQLHVFPGVLTWKSLLD